jgi:rubrerythrin
MLIPILIYVITCTFGISGIHSFCVQFLEKVGAIEKEHEERYRTLLANVEEDKVFNKDEEIEWKCENCGFVFSGPNAPEKCPVCGLPKAHFEERATNFK